MNPFDEELLQRLENYALSLIRMTSNLPNPPLPNHQVAHVLSSNLLQAGTAVGANFTAAMETDNPASKAAQHQTCVQRLAVTAYWLRVLGQTGMVASPEIDPLLAETDELTAIFTASVTMLRRSEEE
ncbi:MAG: four helix bundle protein [Chloroflexaceae bacterium]